MSVGIGHVARVVLGLAKAQADAMPYTTRTRSRAAASWILLACGVMPARVAEALGIRHVTAIAAASTVDAEIAAGGGPKLDLVLLTIGELATSTLDVTVPGRAHRLPVAVSHDEGAETVDRADCPRQRPCPRTACRYHLGQRRDNCTLERAHDTPHSLAEIGDVIGLSVERVRQIETIAIRKLQHLLKDNHA